MSYGGWNNKMGWLLLLALVTVAGPVEASDPAAIKLLTIGGTGSATPLLAQLAEAYYTSQPEVKIRIIDPPIGSNGSIRAVLSGVIDLAIPGKSLSPEEKAQGGQDWKLGHTPFMIVTSRKAPHSGFSLSQLAAIYKGTVTTWEDGSPIRLVLRSPTESDTQLLRALSPAMDQAITAALARPGMLIAANDLENVDLLEKTPDSLGSNNLGLVKSQNRKLQALPIDGVAPSLDTLRQGIYPWGKSLYVVRGPRLSAVGQAFLDFIYSASGQAIVAQSGYIPALPHPP